MWAEKALPAVLATVAAVGLECELCREDVALAAADWFSVQEVLPRQKLDHNKFWTNVSEVLHFEETALLMCSLLLTQGTAAKILGNIPINYPQALELMMQGPWRRHSTRPELER